MFAVPGWSLSSSALKTQAEPASKQPQAPKPDAKSNKRKRANDNNVSNRNVDEMYRRHIEGHKGARKGQKQNGNKNTTKPDKKHNKEQKAQDGNAQASPKPQPVEDGLKPQEDKVEGEGKKANKRQRKNKNKSETVAATGANAESLPLAPPTSLAPPTTQATLTPLQQAMRQKLISSRFRHLNETLYTTPSAKALELFSANPELFDEYHAGFTRQVNESWPANPVDGYVQAIRSRGKVPSARGGKPDKNRSVPPLPRRPNGSCTLADLGCGDGKLASELTPSAKKLNLKLLSYDLHSPNPLITKADISNLPVNDGSVDIAIFCLSLMGTNWVSFVEEAWRVLRGDGKGECWVSEVKSRFGKVTRKKAQIGAKRPPSKTEKKKQKKSKQGGDDDAGSDAEDADVYAEDAHPAADGDETDINAFVEVFRTRGFALKPESVDKSNKMFVRMVFVKQGSAPPKGKHASVTGTGGSGAGKKKFIDRKAAVDNGMSPEEEAAVLKPCVYKIR